MNARTLLSLATAVMLAPATASAQGGLPTCTTGSPGPITSPFAWAIINSECTDLSQYIRPVQAGKTWSMQTPTLTLSGVSIMVSANWNADPFITFGATTTNLVAGPNTYSFLFGTPIVPGLYTNATSTGGVSVTNGASGNTTVDNSAVYPTYISGYGTVAGSPTNLGVDLGTAPCSANGTPFTVTTTCNQGTTANSFAPTFYDDLEALLTYTQNDVGSVASWSGAVTLNTNVIPEPSTVVLLATGLLVFGVVARRRLR